MNKAAIKFSFEAIEQEKCRRSAHYFIFDSRQLKTKDEHDLDRSVKPFPPEPYLRCVLDALLVSGRLLKPDKAIYLIEHGYSRDWIASLYQTGLFFAEKSRQIMATWLTCAYILWRCKYHPHQLALVQSKRLDDSVNLVFNKEPRLARMSFMETSLPLYLQSLVFPKAGAYGQLFFPNGSRAWAIPEGGDIIRSNTPSLVFSDEAAFQPEFGNSFTAALPAIKGGGQYVGISSAEPGEFQALVEAT